MPSESCDHRRTTTTTTTTAKPGAPPPEPEHLPCPRCDSTNTKFCYYNNYNFSQPRHFCKGCRRYWTHGGTLRDIPVGGGSRKNAKRSRLTHNHHSNLSSHSLEFRHVAAPPTATPILIPFTEHGGALHLTESFTSLLSSTHGPGLFGFDQEAGFGVGFGRGIWPFAGIGDNGGGGGGYGQYAVAGGGGGGGGGMTWQAESGEGGGDCFSLPDLAISMNMKL